MDKIKNIKKKFCLLMGFTFLMLPLITPCSYFSFGFVSGLGFAGWMLLPDEEDKKKK